MMAAVLRMGAVALQRSRTALGATCRCTARRKGRSAAVFATARKLAVLGYRMLRYGEDYLDIAEKAYSKRFRVQRITGFNSAGRSLGFKLVKQEPAPA